MMTFQDKETYNWYTRDLSRYTPIGMDTSELPDQAGEVIFWSSGLAGVAGFFAIGKVMIGGGS